MTTVYLIRHGETNWNVEDRMQGRTDIPLNEKGIKQANACGASLQPSQFDRIISSNLIRAKKTAEIINSYLDLPFEELDDLGERDFGDAEGLTMDERNERYPDEQYPNQETKEAFCSRIMGGLDKVHQKYPNQHIIIVSHAAVINQTLEILSGGELGYGRTTIDNTSITTLTRDKDSWAIRSYNQKDHLELDKKM
ncbi:histidine phosphatase family protein [Ornithinibacillus californiensis]|uniref:histidine phosphatase family protein n=1 Tax=Ornithinibacillus californiensis TaxID=161536 RepID=UPI00064D7DBD|nr:histidine phosphatase family protein [Ornithinibacillus californiensis]